MTLTTNQMVPIKNRYMMINGDMVMNVSIKIPNLCKR